MKNVLIAQIKQITNGKLKYIVFLLVLATGLIDVIVFYAEYVSESNEFMKISACDFVDTYSFILYTIMHIFIAIAVSDICAGDFSDKTFYYEVMSGQTRFRSYFSRAIIAIAFVLTGCMLLITVPIVVSTALCGWGEYFTKGDIAIRIAVSAAPLIRIICEYICIAFIIRNTYAVMALGWGGFIISTMAESPTFENAPCEILGITSIYHLCTFESWSNYGLNNVYTPVVDATLPGSEIRSIVIWSVIFAAAFLIVGYSYFKNDDLN